MNTPSTPTYTGQKLKKDPFIDPKTGKVDLNIYIPEDPLIEAVKIAMMLKRPLLLMGEPGCGKTILAKTIAYELHGANYRNNFFRWDIKSTTKAQDGIYRFDAVKRLRMSQEKEGVAAFWKKESEYLAEIRKKYAPDDDIPNAEGESPGAAEKRLEQLYLEYGLIQKGPMAKAFDACRPDQNPPVLLIDEIDKAEIDFPNDLLLEIEDNEYYISETDSRTQLPENTRPPIIIISSNNEKELPTAFLRRCLFHYIEFPREAILTAILNNRFQQALKVLGKRQEEIVAETIRLFMHVRERLKTASEKQDSTSELIDFMQTIIAKVKSKAYTAEEIEKMLKEAQQKGLDGKYKIPFASVLLKNRETLHLLLAKSP